MIQITPQMKIFLCVQPVDFRKGLDGLTALCRNELEIDPFTGALFVFRNRAHTRLKLIVYDGQGYWLFMKRLSKGRFLWWPKKMIEDARIHKMLAHELQIMIWNGDPGKSRVSKMWKPL